ncbi:unnamed protein product [marine sediment metagenome]|uniref:Uncharacterized protein n=1 Tax=marine sediment metagenome TaxID=412755 RepID=X1B4N8_9ZZZZ
MLDSISKNTISNTPMGSQVFFRDDAKFTFRTLKIYKGFLIEGKPDKIKRAFKHLYKLQYVFPGYKGVPAGQVSIGFSRDIFYEPLPILDQKEKPEEGKKLDKSWIGDIAISRIYDHAQQKPEGIMMNVMNWTIYGVLALMGLAFFIVKVAA